MNAEQELLLAEERLHWAMFFPAIITCLVLGLSTLPLIFMLKAFTNVFQQIGGSNGGSASMFIWWPLLFILTIWLCVLIGTCVAFLTSKIRLTEKRLSFRTGFFCLRSGEIPLTNVDGIFTVEPVLGRLAGYGTITVTTNGGRAFPLHFIRLPGEFRDILQSAIDQAKNPRATTKSTIAEVDDSKYMPKL